MRRNKFVEAILREYSSRHDCFEKNQLILKPVVKEYKLIHGLCSSTSDFEGDVKGKKQKSSLQIV